MHNFIKSMSNPYCIGAALLSSVGMPFSPLLIKVVPSFVVFLNFSVFTVTLVMPILARLLLMLSCFPVLLKQKKKLNSLDFSEGQIITVKALARGLSINVLQSYYILQMATRGGGFSEETSVRYKCLK